MSTLIIIIIVILVLVAIGAGLFFWKRGKDISDMKNLAEKSFGSICSNPKEFANCYIDKLVQKFGYLRTKTIIPGTEQPSKQEMDYMNQAVGECCKKIPERYIM